MRAAVLGSPIAHSLSPVLHRAAYASLGLTDWTYDALEVPAGSLASFVGGLGPEWAGLSLTMPLKQEVLPLLTSRSALVEATGAANTVVLGDGLHGENTDVAGIVTAFREAGVGSLDRAAVIGAGATAASAVAALHDLGAHDVAVLSRRPPVELREVAARVGVRLRELTLDPLELEDGWPQAVVSTVPAGALDAFAALASPSGHVPPLLDVVYAPWPTPLASVYAAAGGLVIGGAQMLLHQAAAQVGLMTGRAAPLEAMRAALPGA